MSTTAPPGGGATPTSAEFQQIATTVGAAQVAGTGGGDSGAMADVVLLARGGMPNGFSQTGSGGITGQHFGISYDYTLTCMDAHRNVEATCDGTTVEADATVGWNGNLALPAFSASVSDLADWHLAQLETTAPTVEGDGSLVWDSALGTGSSADTWHLELDAHYAGVLLDSTSLRPIGGEIDYQIHATHDDRDLAVSAVIMFSDSGRTTITLNGTWLYVLDQSTGQVTPVTPM